MKAPLYLILGTETCYGDSKNGRLTNRILTAPTWDAVLCRTATLNTFHVYHIGEEVKSEENIRKEIALNKENTFTAERYWLYQKLKDEFE